MNLDFIKPRRDIFHRWFDLKSKEGLEIAPNWAPLITKQEGNIHYCDRVSYNELIERERTNQGRINFGLEVLPLDFVWEEKKELKDCVPNGKKFDYVVSSHVLEHTPNFLEYLYQQRDVIKDDGHIAFVIPDVAKTAEHFRPLTTVSQLLDAYFFGYTRPTPGQVYEASVHTLELGDKWDFTNKKRTDFPCGYTDAQALEFATLAMSQYIDVHCWSFTAESFLEVAEDLKKIGLFDFDIVDVISGENLLEFYVKLKPNAPIKPNRRQNIMQVGGNARHLQQEIESLRHEIAMLKNSRSWRVTAPLRKVTNLVKS